MLRATLIPNHEKVPPPQYKSSHKGMVSRRI
jgi:hypothetical protein